MKSNFHLNPNTGLYVSIGIAGVSSGGSNNVLYCEMMKTRFFLLREVMTACIYDACGVTSSVYLSQLTRSICRVMYQEQHQLKHKLALSVCGLKYVHCHVHIEYCLIRIPVTPATGRPQDISAGSYPLNTCRFYSLQVMQVLENFPS